MIAIILRLVFFAFLATCVRPTNANVEKIVIKTSDIQHRIHSYPDSDPLGPDCAILYVCAWINICLSTQAKLLTRPCINPPYGARILTGNQTVILQGLESYTQYEIRVCWPASNPADYYITYDGNDSIQIRVIPSGVRMPVRRAEAEELHTYELSEFITYNPSCLLICAVIESTLFGVIPLSSLRVIGLCLLAIAATPYIVNWLWRHMERTDAQKGD
jgi:hypothetical protein